MPDANKRGLYAESAVSINEINNRTINVQETPFSWNTRENQEYYEAASRRGEREGRESFR